MVLVPLAFLAGVTLAGDALEIRVDRVRVALEGMNPGAVTGQVRDLLDGQVASQIQDGEKMIGVRAWTQAPLRDRLAALEQLRLQAPDGHDFPLKRVAALEIREGQAQLSRENLKSMVAVTARIEGRDMGSTLA